jgi:hypothetical protein
MTDLVLAALTGADRWSFVAPVCCWAMVLIGAVTALMVRRELGKAAILLFGLFVLLADSSMYYSQFLIECVLNWTGDFGNLIRSRAWHVIGQLVPVVFAGAIAAGFASEVRKRDLRRDALPNSLDQGERKTPVPVPPGDTSGP